MSNDSENKALLGGYQWSPAPILFCLAYPMISSKRLEIIVDPIRWLFVVYHKPTLVRWLNKEVQQTRYHWLKFEQVRFWTI